ncbi:MAG: radical SAM protein [Ignavibacteriales bacterium]|nr:radical SAM protein [Ignavibacteriales bacterium]
MKKKIYLIQPSYKDQAGKLLKGKKLYIISLTLPALSAIIPDDWEKEFCYEYFEDVNFYTDASIIGISSMGYEIFRGAELADEFRKRGKIVIFGGFQPHISKDYIESHCNSVIHGNPGYNDMTKILNDAQSGVLQKDYYCKTDLNYKIDYTVLDTQRIFFTPVILNVGCYNNCDFCCVASIYKGKYYLRKFKYIAEELEYLHNSTRNIAFIDTNIYNNRNYLIKLCNVMIERKYNFVWGAQCTINIGEDIETLTLMKKAGCKVLFIGMESIEQQNLTYLNKNYKTDSFQQKIKNIHNAGIKIAAFFIYGLDNDTPDTSKQLSRFIIDNNIALPMINILVPIPGSRVYEQLEKEGRILMKSKLDFLKNNIAYNSSFNICFYLPKNMTPQQVEDGFLDLLRRLSGFYQIVKRSLSKSVTLTLLLLYMNWLFRKEYIELNHRKSLK